MLLVTYFLTSSHVRNMGDFVIWQIKFLKCREGIHGLQKEDLVWLNILYKATLIFDKNEIKPTLAKSYHGYSSLLRDNLKHSTELIITLSLLESVMEAILTFESVDEILCCDHSNGTLSAVLSHGTNLYLIFLQSQIWDLSWILILGTLGSERVENCFEKAVVWNSKL